MSAKPGLVDWRLGERTAAAVIAGLPAVAGLAGTPPPSPDGYSATEVRAACSDAISKTADYAGLGPVASPPVAELIDRREWSVNTLATLAEASRPLEQRLAEDLNLPGPLGALAHKVVGGATGVEAGIAVGYVAKRVLGQYDVALFGPQRPARLLFVAENMDHVRGQLDADRATFLRWVALHETTHVVQFERIGWLAGYMRELAGSLISAAADGLDSSSLSALAKRFVRDPRELVRVLMRGELARLVADPEHAARLDRLQATMSVIEGHAEHVMDACAADFGPELDELRRKLDERRARRSGLGEVVGRLLGIEAKLRQYEVGKEFCDGVVAEGGRGSLRLVWRSAADLPSLAELEDPVGWLSRVTEFSRQPA